MTPDEEVVKTVRWLENELECLKTAHEHGLGMIDFFSESVTVPLVPYAPATMVVEFESDAIWAPYLDYAFEPYAPGGVYIHAETWDEANKTFAVSFSPPVEGDCTVRVVSSSRIKTLEVTQ